MNRLDQIFLHLLLLSDLRRRLLLLILLHHPDFVLLHPSDRLLRLHQSLLSDRLLLGFLLRRLYRWSLLGRNILLHLLRRLRLSDQIDQLHRLVLLLRLDHFGR